MTTTVTNRGKKMIAAGDLFTTTFYMGLLGGSSVPSGAHDPDLNTVADLLAVSGLVETSGGGYVRVALSGLGNAEDDTNDWANVTASNVSFGSITSGAGTGRGMFIFKTGASDAARDLFMIADMAPKAFNGTPVTVNVVALFRLVQV